MPSVYVCPLSQIAPTVARTNASHLVSLIDIQSVVVRPQSIPEKNHLFLGINDIVEAEDGKVLPGAEHVRQLVEFAGTWDSTRPILFHCYAGISRSTAAAFITLCTVRPKRDEQEIAARLRAASPFATPNARLVALADEMLGRNGRMIAAVSAIGRGAFAAESIPFAVPLEAGG
jgi:predicted protein tyrosine phosphatase